MQYSILLYKIHSFTDSFQSYTKSLMFEYHYLANSHQIWIYFCNKIFFIKIFQLILKMSDIGLLFLGEKNEFRKMLFVSIKFILPQILTKIIQNLYFKNSIYFNSYFCKNHMENSHTYFFVEKYLATISRTKRTIAVTQNNI